MTTTQIAPIRIPAGCEFAVQDGRGVAGFTSKTCARLFAARTGTPVYTEVFGTIVEVTPWTPADERAFWGR